MSHINVHEGCSGEEMVSFSGDKGDLMVTHFSDMSCGGNPGNPISCDDNVFHRSVIIQLIVEEKNLSGSLFCKD